MLDLRTQLVLLVKCGIPCSSHVLESLDAVLMLSFKVPRLPSSPETAGNVLIMNKQTVNCNNEIHKLNVLLM